eukprot:Amastigsp_a346980_19.p2 type:complete len:130 gc:universal Amastigsp_a346980_19:289-678(+)
MTTLPESSCAGIMSAGSAARMVDDQVLREPGMTKPKVNCHSSISMSFRHTCWSMRKLLISSLEVNSISRDTDCERRMRAGTLASISFVNTSLPQLSDSQNTSPVSESWSFIDTNENPSLIAAALSASAI